MKKLIFIVGLVLLSSVAFSQKISTLVDRGDTIIELTGNEYVSFAELDGSPSTKAIRLQTLINPFTLFNDSIRNILADSILVKAVAHMLVDTSSFSFGFGLGAPTDTAGCFDGAILGIFPNPQDTLVSLSIYGAVALGSGADVDVKIVYAATPYNSTNTTIWSGTLTNTALTSTTFTTKFIPPDVHIWAIVDGPGKATHIYLPYLFAKIRQK